MNISTVGAPILEDYCTLSEVLFVFQIPLALVEIYL